MTEPRLLSVQCLDAKGLHRMAYWEWGDPSNDRVLLCVHGLTRQGRDFDTLARAMCGDYRVVCPDVVGRGESEWLADPMGYGIPSYVADMVTLIARLNPGTLDWVGTSMGGLIGMGVASLSKTPVRRIVLNDVGPRIQASALQRIGSYLGMPVVWPSMEAAAVALRVISAGFGPHTDEQWMALCRPQIKSNGQGGFISRYDPAIAVPFKAVTEAAAQAGEAALWAAYDRITAPTLLLRGAESDLLTRETANEMAQRGPRARLVEFAGVGHAPTIVQDDQVKVVRDFLMANG